MPPLEDQRSFLPRRVQHRSFSPLGPHIKGAELRTKRLSRFVFGHAAPQVVAVQQMLWIKN
jgi:hypothetical protein